MRVPLFKRLTITVLNIVFPPLAVGLLTGFSSPDMLLNCVLFLLAIIPSHIHGFYISFVYFTRKRRARRGRYPGKPSKPGVWSERVLTGGVGWKEAERLRRKDEMGLEEGGDEKASLSGHSGSGSRRSSRRRSRRDKELEMTGTRMSRRSSRGSHRERQGAGDVVVQDTQRESWANTVSR